MPNYETPKRRLRAMMTFGRLIGISRFAAIGLVLTSLVAAPPQAPAAAADDIAPPSAEQAITAANAMLDDYRRKAEAGDADAMLVLGEHYLGHLPLTGEKAQRDPPQGLRWLTMAAERENAVAACALARYHRERKDFGQALRWTRQAADGGDAVCMFALGGALLNGSGVAKNEAEAAVWIGKAAKAGLLPARYKDAELHLFGHGVPRDVPKAGAMFLNLANEGVPGAMLFNCILLGATKPQEALNWCRKAADAGHSTAMYQMATVYLTGAGVIKNESEARRWYQRAAEAGEPESMISLASMFEHGVAGPRSSQEAARWAMKALYGQAVQTDAMLQRPREWSAAFWKEMQARLRAAGVYRGAVDGKFGPGTARAIEAIVKEGA